MTANKPRCPDCGARMKLRSTKLFKSSDDSGQHFYGCSRYPQCKGTVSARADGRLLGTPADAKTRRARIAAHKAFDRVWQEGPATRNEAYRWLAQKMGMTRTKGGCHIGNFNREQCAKAIRLANDLLDLIPQKEVDCEVHQRVRAPSAHS